MSIFEQYSCSCTSSAFWFLDTPSERLAKTNVDAAYQTGVDFIGVGGIVWDSEGVVLACLAKKLEGCISPYEAECLCSWRKDWSLLKLVCGLHWLKMMQIEWYWAETCFSSSGVLPYDIKVYLIGAAGGNRCFVPRTGNIACPPACKIWFSFQL